VIHALWLTAEESVVQVSERKLSELPPTEPQGGMGPAPFLTNLSSDKMPAFALMIAHIEHPPFPAHNICLHFTVRGS